jgi:hypothetical protein
MKKRKPSEAIRLVDEKIFVEVLRIEAEHNRKIDAMEKAVKGLDLSRLKLGLLDTVLDALGVAGDNTVEMEKRYGQNPDNWPAEAMCRDCYHDKWYELPKTTKSEIKEFLRFVAEQERKSSGPN